MTISKYTDKPKLGSWKIATFLFFAIFITNFAVAREVGWETVTVKGFVVSMEDGASLVGVNVYSKKSRVGRVTNNKGYFELTVLKTDTLIFSYVGYETIHLSVADFKENPMNVVVPMTQSVIQLPDITIQDSYELPAYLLRHKPIQLEAFKDKNKGPDVDVPVGSLDYGPLSYFSKEAKEKRILMRNYAAEKVGKTYVRTVTSDSLRNKFMEIYGLSRQEFDDFIIYFNTHPPAMDRQNPRDIARAMHEVFRNFKKNEK